jgi:glycosyltransferase involved in cell wall biosynthesis
MNENVFIIVPAFNEAEVIRETLTGLLQQSFQVVVVDDASSDNTAAILKGTPVHYLRHRINLGQGAALQTGIRYALAKGASIFVTFDADGQHDAADIQPMIERLVAGQRDIIFGSRFSAAGRSGVPILRKGVLHLARYLNFLLTGILLTDAHNGLRVFNRHTAELINIVENGMAHATELLITTQKYKLRYEEVPVTIRYTSYSKKKGQKISHSFKVLQDILLYKIFK